MGRFFRILLVCTAVRLAAQSDLSTASLEELMSMQVTSASRKPQSLSQVSAAVYVLTSEDIRRSGATSIPEVLRWVPGLEVAQIDSNKWGVSARGFNGRLANKMLVLMDGRSLYGMDFSGVFWDLQDTLLEDVDRIEVIRGPGATMWGSNAVNGVINIITKHSKETRGGSAEARAGNYDRAGGSVRYGFGLGQSHHARVWAKHAKRQSLKTQGPRPADNSWDTSRVGFRSDWDLGNSSRFMVQGDFFRANRGLNTVLTSLTPPYFLSPGRGDAHGGMVLGRWSKSHDDLSQTSAQIYYQSDSHADGQVHSRSGVVDLAFQRQQFFGGRHDVQWGGNFRSSQFDMENTFMLQFRPPNFRHNLTAGFLQDEIELIEGTLSAVVGGELEHNTYTGLEVQPTARFLWTPKPRTTIWGAVSRAVRTPSMSDGHVDVQFAVFPNENGSLIVLGEKGSSSFRSETVRAQEIGWRSEWNKRIMSDVAVFYNAYSHLANTRPLAPMVRADLRPVVVFINEETTNGGSGHGYGVELSNRIQLTDNIRLTAAYSHLSLNLRSADNDIASVVETTGKSPRHRGFLQSSFSLPYRMEFDVNAARTGKLRTVPAYTRVDARLGWKWSEAVALSVVGQNLVGPPHIEFDPINEGIRTNSLVRRSFYGQVSWSF